MICAACLLEKPEKDFFPGKKNCFKCIYSEKLKLVPSKVKKECTICKGVLPSTRWKFCSEKCSLVAEDIHNKKYWVRNIKFTRCDWR
jgi:hypothetical protein